MVLQQADDLLLQLCLSHIQRACGMRAPSSEEFPQPLLLSLIGMHSASDDTRFQVCCLLTVFLASANPAQQAKVGIITMPLQEKKIYCSLLDGNGC